MKTTARLLVSSPLRLPVLLIMLGSVIVTAAGCATSRDLVSRGWNKLRGGEEEAVVVESTPASPNVPPKSRPDREALAQRGAESAPQQGARRDVEQPPASPRGEAKSSELIQANKSEESSRGRGNLLEQTLLRRSADVDPFQAAREAGMNVPQAEAPNITATVEQATQSEPEERIAHSPEVITGGSAATTTKTTRLTESESEQERLARLHRLFGEFAPGNPANEVVAEVSPNSENPFAEESLTAPQETNVVEEAVETPTATPEPEPQPVMSLANARLQADTLMLRARIAIRKDRHDDALRLAQAAEKIQKDAQLQYGKQEERPSDLVARLTRGTSTGVAAEAHTVATQASQPEPEVRETPAEEVGSAPVTAPTTTPAAPVREAGAQSFTTPPGLWVPMDEEPQSERAVFEYEPETDPATADSHGVQNTAYEGGDPRVTSNRPARVAIIDMPEPHPVPGLVEPEAAMPAPLPEAAPKSQQATQAAGSPAARKSKFERQESLAEAALPVNDPAPYPWLLVLGIVLGAGGLFGFGIWYRMQVSHFTPRS